MVNETKTKSIYQLGQVSFSIHECDLAFEAQLDAILPKMPSEKCKNAASEEIRLGWATDVRALINRILKKHDKCIWLEAACLISPSGKKVLLSGKSGSGKSTTAFALALKYNFTVLANDITLLDPATDEIIRFASPFSLGAETLELVRGTTDIEAGPIILGEWVACPAANEEFNPRAQFDIAMDLALNSTDRSAQCQSISPFEYTRSLLRCSNLLRQSAVEKFQGYLTEATCRSVMGGSLCERLKLILELCGEAEVASPKEMESTDWKRSVSWFSNTLLIQPQQTVTKAPLQDDLLVSIMGLEGSRPGGGGLIALGCGEAPKVHLIDRLPSSGMWVDDRAFVRSIYHAAGMILHLHTSEGVRVITNPDYGSVHDVRLQSGKLYAVSTKTNEVVQLDLIGKPVHVWKFPGEGDVRHLNGLGLWEGRFVVSCFGRFEDPAVWRSHGKGSGIVFDLETDETLWDGLHLPHSPRIDNGRQFICDSGSRRLLMREGNGRSVREIHYPGAFLRGMAFADEHIYVGLSCDRGFRRGEAVESIPNAAIAVVDRASFEPLYQISLPCVEIYDVVVVPPHDSGEVARAFEHFSHGADISLQQ